MGNAVWLLLALPHWYLSAALTPLGDGLPDFIPAAGMLSLIVGVTLGFNRRQIRFRIFLLSFILSEVFVAIAGTVRGQISEPKSYITIITFLTVQLTMMFYAVYLLKGARAPALAFAVFSLTYAVVSAFVAGMSFTDSWL